MKLEVQHMAHGYNSRQWYVFEDLAEVVYPDDTSISNVELTQEFGRWLCEKANVTVIAELWPSVEDPYITGLRSPHGEVWFDSEGGTMEWHSIEPTGDRAVQWVAEKFREFASSKRA